MYIRGLYCNVIVKPETHHIAPTRHSIPQPDTDKRFKNPVGTKGIYLTRIVQARGIRIGGELKTRDDHNQITVGVTKIVMYSTLAEKGEVPTTSKMVWVVADVRSSSVSDRALEVAAWSRYEEDNIVIRVTNNHEWWVSNR